MKYGELFCGAGGLSLGALQAKVRDKNGEIFKLEHAFASDSDPWACETYTKNICRESVKNVYNCKVEDLNFDVLQKIDLLAFGFPCNDFSIVGEHKGINGKYGGLYRYGKDFLDRQRPKYFVAENVGGLQSANGGETLRVILDDLSNAGAGYLITAHKYKFEEYGVPQTRHRIIIVGIARSENLRFRVPVPTTKSTPRTAQDALENPPIKPDAPNHEFTRQSKTVIERLRHIPEGENAWFQGLPTHLRLNVPNTRLSQIYKRLTANKPAYTLTGSGGGGTHMYHWNENRALTNRERARIQTFPDSYIFYGSKESVRRQIGMAVPPHGAKIIFTSLLNTIAGIQYKSIEAHWDNK